MRFVVILKTGWIKKARIENILINIINVSTLAEFIRDDKSTEENNDF